MNLSFLSTAHIHTRSFIENITSADDGRRVLHIWDDNEDRGKRYAAEANAEFVSDLEAVIGENSADGFIICAENTRHLPLLEKALATGKPVFCEKPLVTSTSDLAAVRKMLATSSSPLFCGYFLPFSPAMQAVKQLVREGAFGDVRRVRFRNAHHAAIGRWFDNPDLRWFTEPELSGGGAFIDLGTHAIHLLRTLFGEVSDVWADIANESAAYPDVDDTGIAHLGFKNGIRGTVEASWTQTGGIGGLEIIGSDQALWNTPEGYVIGSPGKPPVSLSDAPAQPTRVDRLAAVIRGKIPQNSLNADLEATIDSVAILEAAYRSADKAAWVKLGQ